MIKFKILPILVFRGMCYLGCPSTGSSLKMTIVSGTVFFAALIISTVDAAAMMTAPQR